MAGINQTILMCLSMVVIASLIGAKGLGEDVLNALQYAAVGQGLLAGIALRDGHRPHCSGEDRRHRMSDCAPKRAC